MARKASTAKPVAKKIVEQKMLVVLMTGTIEGSQGDTVELDTGYAYRLIAKGMAKKVED